MNKMVKERYSAKEPLFIRFLNKEVHGSDLLTIFSKSPDPFTSETATKALGKESPDLTPFRNELKEAVLDIIKEGPGEEFKAFVNHYMEPALIEDVQHRSTQWGDNLSRVARIKDEESTWLEGFLCYNLCLYIKAIGLENLKSCRVCGKFFANKGRYAVYCSESCKKQKVEKK
jgi:hypothetical protein